MENTQYATRILPIARAREDSFDKYYNSKSGLIVLGGPRGDMLARYAGQETPESGRHEFLTTYPTDYNVFESARPPELAPADVDAVCWPVEKGRDPKLSVSSGAASTTGTNQPAPNDRLITAKSSGPMTEQTGVRVSEEGVHVRGKDGGISVDGNGIRMDGSFKNTSPEKRGITQQSPIFGILPKSAVTFFAADFLPAVNEIQKLAKWVQRLKQAKSWLGLLTGNLKRSVADDGSPYGPDSTYNDSENDYPNNDSRF